jgi:hypothetical protein
MSLLSDLSDILLGAGALGAAVYCLVLSRRLRRFTDLENGVGGAVAVLSAQVDDLSRTLARAEGAAKGSVDALAQASQRAEGARQRLELLLAAMHDLPPAAPPRPAEARPPAEPAAAATPPQPEAPPAPPVFVRHPDSLERRPA